MLIFLGHLEPGTLVLRFLYSFHLFLFFACAGFVGVRYQNRRYSEILIKNVKRLLIPFFFWGIISQVIDLIQGDIGILQAIQYLFYWHGNVGWNTPLWFLLSLFWADSICAILTKMKKAVQIIVAVLMIVLWILANRFQLLLPFGLYTIPPVILFWLAGYWINAFGIYQKFFFLNKRKLFSILFSCVLFAILIVCGVLFNQAISIYYVWYQNIPLTIIGGLAGVLLLFFLSTLIKDPNRSVWKIIKKYGNNTLLLLCTHFFFLRLVRILSVRLVGTDMWRFVSFPKAIIIAVLLIALYYPIILGAEKLKGKHNWLKYLI